MWRVQAIEEILKYWWDNDKSFKNYQNEITQNVNKDISSEKLISKKNQISVYPGDGDIEE